MEEKVNLSQDDVLERIMNFPLEPMFNKVIITLNNIEEEGLALSDNVLSETQYVLAVGPTAQVKPGQKVLIDVEKMMVPSGFESTNQYNETKEIKLDLIQVDEVAYAFIEDRFIKAKDNR